MDKFIRAGLWALLAIAVLLGASACTGDKEPAEGAPSEEGSSGGSTSGPAASQTSYIRTMAVVTGVEEAAGTIEIYDIENGRALSLLTDGATAYKDAYGSALALSDLAMGDMVETKYDTATRIPEYVRITAIAWERKDTRYMAIDKANRSLAIGSDRYTWNDELVVAKDGRAISLDELDPSDEVVARGYKDTVWAIVVLKGHGTLALKNHWAFVDGVLTVDAIDTYKVDKRTAIPLVAGSHDILISQTGMTPFRTTVEILEGQETVLDMSGVPVKVGMVDFVYMQDDVRIYVDDILRQMPEDLTLPFGIHTIRGEKDGYAPFTGQIEVNQAYIQYKVDLAHEPIYVRVDAPEGSELYIDGSYVGIVPATAPIDPGEHVVTLRKEGFYPKNHPVVVDDTGQNIIYAFPDLVPMPGSQEPAPEEEAPVEE